MRAHPPRLPPRPRYGVASIEAPCPDLGRIATLPVSLDAAEGLYRLVDAAYERRSVAVSSNLHPSGFDELMPKTLASPAVDRLMHHAHVCVTTGDGVRRFTAELVPPPCDFRDRQRAFS